MKIPCKDCINRTLGCHSDCIDYKTFRAELDQLNHKIRMNRIDMIRCAATQDMMRKAKGGHYRNSGQFIGAK